MTMTRLIPAVALAAVLAVSPGCISTISEAPTPEATEATAGLDRKSKEAREKTAAVYNKYRDQTSEFYKKVNALTKQLDKLVPGPQRKSFVWLYERL